MLPAAAGCAPGVESGPALLGPPAAAGWEHRGVPQPPRASPASLAGAAFWAAAGALFAIALAGGAQVGRPMLVAFLLPMQLVLALCWLAYVGAPDKLAGLGLASGAAVVADLLAGRSGADMIGTFAGIIAVVVVLAVLAALLRGQRVALTETLAAQVSAVLVVLEPATYVALRGTPGGREALVVSFLALAGAAVLGRMAALLLARPAWLGPVLPPWSRMVTVVGSWAAIGALIGAALRGGDGALIGAAAAGAGGLADLAVAGVAGRRRSLYLGSLLPLSLAAPVVYVLGRTLFG